MFDQLLLHAQTLRVLKRISKNRAQGYLFVGPSGSGKYNAARKLAQHWGDNKAELVIELVPQGKQSIGIQEVHQLRLRLGQRLGNNEQRTIVIDNASLLTVEAQNALLKVLEEPPAHTTFILITDTLSGILPTVRSRLQTVRFPYLSQNKVVKRLEIERGLTHEQAVKAYFIGHKTIGGALGVLNTMADVEQAKAFLTANHFDRLTVILSQLTEREHILTFLKQLQSIYEAILWQAAARGDLVAAGKSATRLEILGEIQAATQHNGNLRLLGSRLVLEL